jgi:SAM-dependent methyltransferase
MSDNSDLPRLYRDLADWWPVLSAPEDYAEEAEFYRRAIMSEAVVPPKTLLELGCGGGNNASHLKKYFLMTLVDISPGMLDVSRSLNPECEHALGDMRDVRLGRHFDAVFIHDAIVYMTTEQDLRRAIRTAYEHCRPEGVVLFAPDFTRETFRARTSHGGHDHEHRALRYLEWDWDPDPGDTTYFTDMVYLLREEGRTIRCIHDRHTLGLFSRDVWIKVMTDTGFAARSLPFAHSEFQGFATDVFVGRKSSEAAS